MHQGERQSGTEVVFLVCSERSGSNLLRAMLDAHPQIHAPMPVHLGGTLAKRLHRYGDLQRDEAWAALVGDAIKQMESTKGALDVLFTEEELREGPRERTFEALYRYVYDRSLQQCSKPVLALKETHLHKDLGFYLACYPNARFVVQVRDPRDYALSCIKAGRYFTHYGSVPAALDVWTDDQHGALNLASALGPERVHLQRYEDLVTSTERVLTSLCGFLGVDFDGAMLAFNEQKAAKDAADRHPSYWGNLAKPVQSDNTAKYKTGLSRTTIALVEQRTKTLMRRFDYALEDPSPGLWRRTAVQIASLSAVGGSLRQWARRTAKRILKRTRRFESPAASMPMQWTYSAESAAPAEPERATAGVN